MSVQMVLDSAGGCDVCLGRSLTPQPGRGRSLTPRPSVVFDPAGAGLWRVSGEQAFGTHTPSGVAARGLQALPTFGLMAPTVRSLTRALPAVGSPRSSLRPLAREHFSRRHFSSRGTLRCPPNLQAAFGPAKISFASLDVLILIDLQVFRHDGVHMIHI